MSGTYSLSIVVPALNEEENFKQASESMLADLGTAGIDWEIIIVDDGSTDATGKMADELARKMGPRVKVIHHAKPMGIGASIRDGVKAAAKDAVTWLPGDGENDPAEVFKYLPLIEHVDCINPFVINKDVRSRSRQRISGLFTTIINISFGTRFNYTNGNVIYRRKVFEAVRQESTGFFFQTECLVKASRAGFTIAEVPIRIRVRAGGESKALTFRSLKSVARDYLRLVAAVYFQRDQ